MRVGRWTIGGFTAVAVGMLAALAQGQDPKEQAAPKAANNRGGMPDLVKGLKETPGCLGVETAQTSSGKNVIFAWFKDKKAALAWYSSPMHKRVMNQLGGGPTRKPMEHIADDDKPIMVIASITPAKEPKFEEVKMPISQIAVELYQPLPGGAALGGRFAPSSGFAAL